MVRPKPSFEILKVALNFANAVTKDKLQAADCNNSIDVHGSESIYSLLCECFPSLGQGKFALSEKQLNKHLVKHGYIPFRHRNRIKGTKDQWDRGCYRWKNRCWVDPAQDLTHLKACLDELDLPTQSLKISVLNVSVQFLENMFGGFLSKSAMARSRVWQPRRHRLLLGEAGIRPCATMARIRPELAPLLNYFYHVNR